MVLILVMQLLAALGLLPFRLCPKQARKARQAYYRQAAIIKARKRRAAEKAAKESWMAPYKKASRIKEAALASLNKEAQKRAKAKADAQKQFSEAKRLRKLENRKVHSGWKSRVRNNNWMVAHLQSLTLKAKADRRARKEFARLAHLAKTESERYSLSKLRQQQYGSSCLKKFNTLEAATREKEENNVVLIALRSMSTIEDLKRFSKLHPSIHFGWLYGELFNNCEEFAVEQIGKKISRSLGVVNNYTSRRRAA